jgi:hypothetical protein
VYSAAYALHGARQGAPCIRHNFITIARRKKIRPVNCITSTGVALRYFVSGELTGGTFTPIGGSHAPRRCLSSEAAAR